MSDGWTIRLLTPKHKQRMFTESEFRAALKREERNLEEAGRPLIDPEWRNNVVSNARNARPTVDITDSRT